MKHAHFRLKAQCGWASTTNIHESDNTRDQNTELISHLPLTLTLSPKLAFANGVPASLDQPGGSGDTGF